jgi:TolA-binding protein
MKVLKVLAILTMVLILTISCEKKLSEMEYYQAATEAFNKQDFEKSIDYFKKIIKHYPESQRAADALFMLGYINANHTNDLEAAEKFYKQFIENFPDSELADDAQYELDHLGKDINELPIFKDSLEDSLPAQPAAN